MPQHSRRFLAVTLMLVYRFGAEVSAVVYYHVLDEQMRKGDGVVGFVLALVLLALAVAIIPLRFTRAIRRGLGDPEFRSLFGLVVLTLAAGTMFYWEVEEWSLLDSFYFSAITLSTVGYGDLVPTTAGGKLFTVFYVFAGVGIIFAFVEAVARASVAQRGETRALLRRLSGSSELEKDYPSNREEEDQE